MDAVASAEADVATGLRIQAADADADTGLKKWSPCKASSATASVEDNKGLFPQLHDWI
jgi:hypothetical protein